MQQQHLSSVSYEGTIASHVMDTEIEKKLKTKRLKIFMK